MSKSVLGREPFQGVERNVYTAIETEEVTFGEVWANSLVQLKHRRILGRWARAMF